MKMNTILSLEDLGVMSWEIISRIENDADGLIAQNVSDISRLAYFHLLQNKLWADFAKNEPDVTGIMIQSYPVFNPRLIMYFKDGRKLEYYLKDNEYPTYYDFLNVAQNLVCEYFYGKK